MIVYNIPSTVPDTGDTPKKSKNSCLQLTFKFGEVEKKIINKIYSTLYGNKDYGEKESKAVN